MDSSFVDWKNSQNHFAVNPRWPLDVQNFFEIGMAKVAAENQIEASLFIPTSGTTAKDLRDTKIVWVTKNAFLRAAEAVGNHFNFSSKNRVAITLPKFHVGGLSQEARKETWGQELFYFPQPWQAKSFFEFLLFHRITHTSLVPTQLFDIVQAGLRAPSQLECVFIGGGALGQELFQRAEQLGWPLQITYGMTETAALVAVGDGERFKPLAHAEMSLNKEGFLKIKASSLFNGYFRREKQEFILDQKSLKGGWFTTEDLAAKQGDRFAILGRANDYAKIGGEGVYLGRLQTLLQDSYLQAKLPAFGVGVLRFVPSERLGAEVHLVSTFSEAEVRVVIDIFNLKVLPFERIRGFHQVQEIPLTELGKVRRQEIE